jgi:glucose-1-phosphate cytidylyltransferase
MKVVILCGGQGVRAFPFTTYMPKPMLPLGGTPVIVHVIRSFVRQGFREIILAAGYRRSVLGDYFEGKDMGASVTVVDTGEETDTGGRVFACRDLVGDEFMVTYGDGLCDVPLRDLVRFHHASEKLLTITSVPMTSQYGVMRVEADGAVTSFGEKPLIRDRWINAGFMVMSKPIFDNWGGDNLERDVIPPLVERGLVQAFRHDGFFKSFDFYKDVLDMDEIIERGETPWIPAEPGAGSVAA